MSRNRILILSIFILSLSLRFILSLLNYEANDPHVEVVEWIINHHSLPDKDDCWECFQPKLYYIINAGIIQMLGIDNRMDRILCMQMFNFVLSFFILFYLWKFIARQHFSEKIKIAAFALLAFNPCLTGINVQATNDTPEILAGILTIYFADRFFNEKKLRMGFLLCASVIIACLVKGSGLILIVSLAIIFSINLIASHIEERKLYIKILAILVISFIAIIPVGSGCIHNYHKYGTPFVLVLPKDPPPLFFKHTYAGRPGITSVVDGYFTFRYFDMIREPFIVSTIDNYQLHRTSLWSQLYGRTMFMHFDQHPNSWKSMDPKLLSAGRWLIALGIVPLILLIAGMVKTIRHFFKEKITINQNWIHLVFAAGFLLFMIKYSYSYRDFSIMKSIFIFPALPSFIKFFMEGFSMLKSKLISNTALFIICLIILLSIYDIYFLITQLWF